MHLYLYFNQKNLKPCKLFIYVCMYCYAVARRALRPTYHLGALAPRCTALPALCGAGLTIGFSGMARSNGPPP